MSVPSFVIKEWQLLNDSSKKKFLKEAFRNKNTLQQIKKNCNLVAFRDVKLLALDLPESSLQHFESALFKLDDGLFFNKAAQTFLKKTDIEQTFHELLSNDEDWPSYLKVYQTLHTRYRDNEYLQFFLSVSVWVHEFGIEEYQKVLLAIDSSSEKTLPVEKKSRENKNEKLKINQHDETIKNSKEERAIDLNSIFTEVDKFKQALLSKIEKLDTFLIVEKKTIIEDLDQIILRVTHVHDTITKLDKSLNNSLSSWANRNELAIVYGQLLKQQKEKNYAKDLALTLASHLRTTFIIHRLPAKKKKLETLKDNAITELKTSELKIWPINSNSNTPSDWLTSYFNLEGSPLEDFLDQLQQGNPLLAEFLSELEGTNLEISTKFVHNSAVKIEPEKQLRTDIEMGSNDLNPNKMTNRPEPVSVLKDSIENPPPYPR